MAGVAPSALKGFPIPAGALTLGTPPPVINQTFFSDIIPYTGALAMPPVLCDPLETVLPGTFGDIVLVETYPSTQPYVSRPEPFASLFQRVGEILIYGLDWTNWLANYWVPAAGATVGATVRPSEATGYQYVCVAAGQTGASEPMWPAGVGEEVLDGSVLWTSEPIDNTSLEAIVTASSWTAPGLTLSGNFLSGQTSIITVNSAVAVSGEAYTLMCTARFSDGQVKTGEIILNVR